MRLLRFAVAVAALVVEAAVAIALVFTSTSEENPWLTTGFAVTAGVLFACSGLVAMWRRPENATGLLMAAVGYTWFLGALEESGNDWVFTIGAIIQGTAILAFVALALAFPIGRLATGAERAIVASTAALLFGGATLRAMLTSDPVSGCEGCAHSTIVVVEAPRAADAVEIVSAVVGVGLVVAIVVVLTRRWRGATPARRRVLGPVLLSSSAALVALAVSDPLSTLAPVLDRVTGFVFLAVFATVPLSFLYGVLRTRLVQSAAATMFATLEEGASLRDALARALSDPSLEIAYWLQERGVWVDADGARAPVPEPTQERSVRAVEHGSEKIAAFLYDPALDTEPELLDSVVAAASLSLRNEGLRASLRAQYLFLETITDTAPSLLIAIGLDGRILNQNRAAVRAAGYDDQEDVRGRMFWDTFIDPIERDAVVHRFFAAAPDHESTDYENAFTNRLGERYVIDWRNAPLRDDHGAVISIICGGTDVTDRKARELELARERDATATVLQSIPSVIVVLGPDLAIRDRDIHNPLAAVNRAFREGLGWKDEDLVQRPFPELIAASDRGVSVRVLETAFEGTPSGPVVTRWLTSTGDEVVFEWTATPIADVTGRTDRLVLVSGTDVTERSRYEAEIRASRARLVRAADEERRRLERNLHDGAQQRLVAVSVALRLAESKLVDDRDQAGAVLANARLELANALEELRELARGIHPAVLTDRGLTAALQALVTRSPVPVEADVPELDLDTEIEAAIYYVASESLANIAKHAGATTVALRVERGTDDVAITVEDNGMGGADADGGSGLRGLADRLAALDGSLEVESPSGRGTRIRGLIPAPQSESRVGTAVPNDTGEPD